MIQILKIFVLSFVILGVALSMVGLIIIGNTLPQERVYDCSMADFHPDFPPKIREECRKLRLKNSITV